MPEKSLRLALPLIRPSIPVARPRPRRQRPHSTTPLCSGTAGPISRAAFTNAAPGFDKNGQRVGLDRPRHRHAFLDRGGNASAGDGQVSKRPPDVDLAGGVASRGVGHRPRDRRAAQITLPPTEPRIAWVVYSARKRSYRLRADDGSN